MSPNYHQNRSKLWDQLSKHRGEWVAFSLDGSSIVESGASLLELKKALLARDQNPSNVVVEHIPEDDICLGAGEFG